MAYVSTADSRHDFVAATPKPKPPRGLFQRIFDAMVEARQRAAEREIVAYLEGGGQALTDEAEREIERILSSSSRF
jgi:hypothetical protein